LEKGTPSRSYRPSPEAEGGNRQPVAQWKSRTPT
jgi:hypothetical protein